MVHSLTIIETILRNRLFFFGEVRGSKSLGQKTLDMMISCLVFFALYGAVMGAAHSPLQALSSAVKLPMLFLITLLICTPSLHFFNILFGSKQTLPQTIALVLTAMSTTAVLLVSFAPVTLFFLLTSRNYPFLLLLNVAFFAISGVMGIVFLRQGFEMISESDNNENIGTRRLIFTIWVVLYAFVGSQMAYTLSPFVGDSSEPFVVLTQFGDNFYSYLFQRFNEVLIGAW
ncbi:MAG: actin-binding WH2 domain-containing protein [Anaerolineae bacterium]|nr:actin-binding WH2 domain-containing protein [Anaerolineae bacterium]